MIRLPAILLLLTATTLIGCDKLNLATSKEINELRSENSDLKKKMSEIEKRISDSESRIQFSEYFIMHTDDWPARVSTETTSYSIATTRMGKFTISVENVTPYLDGYKVQLSAGNLLDARFNGFTAKISWGPNNGRKDKEFKILGALLPGSFNTFEVFIPNCKIEDLKDMQVQIIPDQIFLNINKIH